MSTYLGPARTRQLPVLSQRVVGVLAGVIVALVTAFFLLANGAGLSDPGLQYDELLFVNAALGNTHAFHGFIYSESLGVPTMLMPYIGALKAWIYTPIFYVFGVSVDSIRVPILLLAALTLMFAVLLVHRLLGTWAAVALAVLLATDPVYGAVSALIGGRSFSARCCACRRCSATSAFSAGTQCATCGCSSWRCRSGCFNKLDMGGSSVR